MKKMIKIFFIINALILIRLISSLMINNIIKEDYKKQVYDSKLIKSLYIFNFNQPYIAYYNEGNILYNLEEYGKAKEKYEQALSKRPAKGKVCLIRVNLSLAIIKAIDTSDYKNAFNRLEEAKNNLYNNNCANPIDDSGYSKKAEQLEEEIKKLEEQLKNQTNNNNQVNKEDKNESNKTTDPSVEAKLKEIEKKAYSSRQEDLTTSEELSDYSYYSGKKW